MFFLGLIIGAVVMGVIIFLFSKGYKKEEKKLDTEINKHKATIADLEKKAKEVSDENSPVDMDDLLAQFKRVKRTN
jgi:uncharacterized membrane-anchored protein YhcB (DUF1043 family)